MKIWFVCLFLASAFVASAASPVDFASQIQPVLEKSCVSCHGPAKHKASLRLDSRAAALKGGDDGIVIIPGAAAKSDLIRRISLAAGTDDVMPPNGPLLSKAQIALLRDWINQGASWPDSIVLKAETDSEPVLADYKPGAAEMAAINRLETMGVDILPIAAGLHWQDVNLRGSDPKTAAAALSELKTVGCVVNLNLGGASISDSSLSALDSLTNLQSLHLEHTRITDAGLAHLEKLRRLTYLNLYDTPVTDAGLEHLKGLSHLRDLHLWQTKVSDAGVKALQEALPRCQIMRGFPAPLAVEPVKTAKNAK